MTTQESDSKGLRLYPPPPQDFDPFAATEEDLKRHGLPLRPDAQQQPGMAALWERLAHRYSRFEHLEAKPHIAAAAPRPVRTTAAIGPDPIESCGYSFFSTSGPFTALFVTWTIPDLEFNASPTGLNHFHTFVGLGFLDVHVEMTVDPGHHVTTQISAVDVGTINLPVGPGDVISGSLCLDTNPPGRANYVLANQTRSQTVNFAVDTGFPPAVTIDAGVSRGQLNEPFNPLARFGVVYFDEISAYTTGGPVSLTAGDAITMVNQQGAVRARPVRLNDFAFKAVFAAP